MFDRCFSCLRRRCLVSSLDQSGVFVSKQKGDTDMGSKVPKDILVKGEFIATGATPQGDLCTFFLLRPYIYTRCKKAVAGASVRDSGFKARAFSELTYYRRLHRRSR